MNPGVHATPPASAGANGGPAFNKVVLRLVKRGPERRAIEAGEVDAILDPGSGGALLLPAAQRWLLERAAHPRTEASRPDHPTRASLDGLAAEVCVLDAGGRVLSANRAWRESARNCLGGVIAEGDNYLAACDQTDGDNRLDGRTLAAGIRQVLAGERGAYALEYACGPYPERRWFTLAITAVDDGSGPARAMVQRSDVSAHKRAELLLTLEYAVACGLAEASTASAALKTVIRTVCEALHWDCGRYFQLDPAAPVLRCQESWGVATPAIDEFLDQSRTVVLHPGLGLKGRVYRSGQPLWIVAGERDAVSATALPPESDRDGAFIFPVLLDGRPLGVLAFSGPGIRAPDDRLLHTVRAIGSQLGRFLHRQLALDALRASEERFRRLTLLSTDWYWEQDEDFRYTTHVGAGVLDADAVLGLAPWELPNLVPGSAAWDDHRAQLGQYWSFCDFEFCATGADGETGYYSISGEPVFNAAGDFTGYWGTGQDITRRKRAEIALRENVAASRRGTAVRPFPPRPAR